MIISISSPISNTLVREAIRSYLQVSIKTNDALLFAIKYFIRYADEIE